MFDTYDIWWFMIASFEVMVSGDHVKKVISHHHIELDEDFIVGDNNRSRRNFMLFHFSAAWRPPLFSQAPSHELR